jgi:hypothetical protein
VNLLVVDVQPEYAATCATVARQLPGLLDQAARAGGKVLALFVGGELSKDRAADVGAYWIAHGVGQEQLDRVTFLEKGYNFFRGWMDNGVAQEVIVGTAKSLRDRQCWDTTCLAPEELIALGADPNLETLYMPDCLEGHAPAFEGTRWFTCGGGVTECLLETELWMRSRDIPFERSAAVY